VCVIAFAAAALLTLIVLPLDAWAIADWRQNAIDTAGIVTSAFCVGTWLFAGTAWLNLKTRRLLGDMFGKAKRETKAARTLRRLSVDQPTMPLTVPPNLRSVK
jgi:hypothetical protein